MPWSEACTMDLRIAFIHDWLASGDVTNSAERAGISRKTAYKWIGRYHESGKGGLGDHSRRPRRCPHATPSAVADALIDLRRQHPTWGAKKLVAKLSLIAPELPLPAVSTASDIIDRAGLVRERRQRRRLPKIGRAWPRGDRANAIWCTDYKGQFRTLDGAWCYPLTVTDEHSRFILACQGHAGIDGDDVRSCFEQLFRRHGLPDAIRSDNGSPFASTGLCRLSRVSVWWMRLGIALKRNAPAQPQHNGRHERMHRDLKAETTRPPAATMRSQQRRFDDFVHQHNYERPHEGLGQQTPSTQYRASPRPYPERLPDLEYPSHYERRRVAPNGCVSLWNGYVFIGHALCGQDLGLVEHDDGLWTVYFGSLAIGIIDRRTRRVLTVDDEDNDAVSARPDVA
ncbi:MAG TPA: IS481 family transposase [Candidatus Limnocylindrales bacterium]|nr:IS481 family transposase [Candidatus Limnocylindrales bacterium]